MNLSRHIAFLKAAALLLLLPHSSAAQDLLVQNKHVGFNIGANFALGSHFQRLGLNFNFFYVNGALQANTEARAYFNLKNLGPRLVYPELVVAQGLVYGYGSMNNWFNPFLSSISNQTGHASSVAYSYNLYFNNIRTSQQTGIVALQFGAASLIVENDILARTYYDRFRTGAFLLQYQHKDVYQAAVNCSLWTGKMGRTMSGGNCSWPCYMDTVRGVYAGYSHGLLSAQFKYNIGASQNVQANVGVDAEQVRNVMQNKFIHDMPFIPAKWIKNKNCHLPMLDTAGGQYLCLPGQKVKKPKLYWNVFSNASVFY